MRTFWSLPLAASLATSLALNAVPATAATLATTFDIAAFGFSDVLGFTMPPVDPVIFRVRLTFDPTAGDQFDIAAGLTLLTSSVAFTGPLAFDYDSTNDILTLGGVGLSTSIQAGTNDVLAEISGAYSAKPTFGGFEYTSAATSGIYLSSTGAASVPEPTSILVVFSGFAALATRRRRR